MAPIGVACHAMPRWLTTPLAASPASFQPSNPAMATGEASPPASLNSMTPHLPHRGPSPYRLRGQPYPLGDRGGGSAVLDRNPDGTLWQQPRIGPDEHSTGRTY